MSESKCELGLIGLGAMGRNLALNLAEHGVAVAVYNRSREKTESFMAAEAGALPLRAAFSLPELVGMLERPRAVLMMVPAGSAVDQVIAGLEPVLAKGDVIIDGGNSHFTDTDRRLERLERTGLWLLGLGVSGGEEGARHGPSLMPGGRPEAFERVRGALEGIAARVDGEPCVALLGPGSAGHYVKMVHNGIEYALMELIAECYDLLRRGLRLEPPALQEIFRRWSEGEAGSYLLEITAGILGERDPEGGGWLIDAISDRAGQKGTGLWSSQEALLLQSPAPAIDAAVALRDVSARVELRARLAEGLGAAGTLGLEPEQAERLLGEALHAGTLLCFCQGLSLLGAASHGHGYGLDEGLVCRLWRGGCIIRARVLEDLAAAYAGRAGLESPLLDAGLAEKVLARTPALRTVVAAAAGAGLPASGFMACLAFLDAMRSARLPTDLVQAQRDYFGGHGFERTDRPGLFRHRWQG